MNRSESPNHQPQSEQIRQSTDYQQLLSEAQVESRVFQADEAVTVIGAGGEPVPGRVLKVESRHDDMENRDYDYVTVGYQVPNAGGEYAGTVMKTETVRADKLARMQITDEQITAVAPDQAKIESALNGE